MKTNGNILTIKFLKDFDACEEGIQFAIRNKLIGFPFSRLNEVKGDYRRYVSWLKYICIRDINSIINYDENENLVYLKDFYLTSNGIDSYEEWREYDKIGNMIHLKKSNGFEEWREYNKNRKLIHSEDSDYYEEWWEYDDHGNEIYNKKSNLYEFWKKYDEKGNLIYLKKSNGFEELYEYDNKRNLIYKQNSGNYSYWYEYDNHGNIIFLKSSSGYEERTTTKFYPNGQLEQINNLHIPLFT